MNIKTLLFALLLLISWSIVAQDKVLVFTKTNGFRHPSINAGVNMITNLGVSNGLWSTDQTDNPQDFNATNLARYKAVIWCNTSGNNLLNAIQRQAFEAFIAAGGGFVGIHAATDTYRDRSWPFYNELVGAIVQTNPNHTSNNFNATMTIKNTHPSVDFLGNSWNKSEEYYYWKRNGGQLFDGNIVLLEVASTGNNDYDEARPISWFKEYGGGRSFYTALGHNASDYTGNDNFIKHVEEGIKYAIGNSLSINEQIKDVSSNIYSNPVKRLLEFSTKELPLVTSISIYTLSGNLIFSHEIPLDNKVLKFDVSHFANGLYIGKLKTLEDTRSFKFVKI